MTHEEIIAMAREASSMARLPWNGEWIFRSKKELMAFVALVAAKEREACAQLAGDSYYGNPGELNHEIAAAIRARGQKEELV